LSCSHRKPPHSFIHFKLNVECFCRRRV
jgi:hypothetical protein